MEDKSLILLNEGVEITPVSLAFGDNVTQDVWQSTLNKLRTIEGATQWWIGDALIFGEKKWGSMYEDAINESEAHSWRTYKYVASQLSIRMDKLSWNHHSVVAPLEPAEQEELLHLCVEKDWTIKELKDEIRRRNIEVKNLGDFATSVNLYAGDMVQVLKNLDKCYDCVIADPPYNVTNWGWDQQGTPQEFISTVANWLEAIKLHLKPAFNLFWFCSPSYSADTEMLLRELDLPIQSRLIWHRRNMAKGSDTKFKFIDSWEMIFHCGNKELNLPAEWTDLRFDVQTFAVPQTNFGDAKVHPTQKPEELIRWLVSYGSFLGEHILDPFAGSGVTGVVSVGRTCDLIELDDDYISIIERRLNVKRISS